MGYKVKHDSKERTDKGLLPLFETEIDLETVVSRFKAGASLEEGVSGRKYIDTTYDNNRPLEEVHPRGSDLPGGYPDEKGA